LKEHEVIQNDLLRMRVLLKEPGNLSTKRNTSQSTLLRFLHLNDKGKSCDFSKYVFSAVYHYFRSTFTKADAVLKVWILVFFPKNAKRAHRSEYWSDLHETEVWWSWEILVFNFRNFESEKSKFPGNFDNWSWDPYYVLRSFLVFWNHGFWRIYHKICKILSWTQERKWRE